MIQGNYFCLHWTSGALSGSFFFASGNWQIQSVHWISRLVEIRKINIYFSQHTWRRWLMSEGQRRVWAVVQRIDFCCPRTTQHLTLSSSAPSWTIHQKPNLRAVVAAVVTRQRNSPKADSQAAEKHLTSKTRCLALDLEGLWSDCTSKMQRRYNNSKAPEIYQRITGRDRGRRREMKRTRGAM